MGEKDKNLAEKVLDIIKNFVEKLKSIFNTTMYAPKRALQEEVNGEIKYYDDIVKKFDEVLKGAIENRNKAVVDDITQIKEIEGKRFLVRKSSNGDMFVDVDVNGIDVANGASIALNIAVLLKKEFKNLLTVNKQMIRVNSTTNREFRQSDWAKGLYSTNKQWYDDKIRSLKNADEILKVAKNWVNENIKHERTDDIVSFGRAKNVLYKVGNNGYEADVLVGVKRDGSAVLYDIIDIKDKKIEDAGKVGEDPSSAENASLNTKDTTSPDFRQVQLSARSYFDDLYETMDDGRIKAKNVSDLSTEDWDKIYKAVKKLGYDVKSGKDAKEIFGKYVAQNGFNREQSEAIKAAYSVSDNVKATHNPQRTSLAKKEYGTTTDFREAGYLLYDGTMLDFSGKKDGGPGGVRYMDHREIARVFGDEEVSTRYGDNTAYMNAFINEGNVRLMDSQGVTLGEIEPTEKQYTKLKSFVSRVLKNEGYFYLDLSNTDGSTIESREYGEADTADRIIRDIKEYYKNGELPYRSNLQEFRYSARDTEYLELAKDSEKNEAKLRKMVDAEARKNGYNVKTFHGTEAIEDFTIFKTPAYFATRKDIANTYAKGKIFETYINTSGYLIVNGNESNNRSIDIPKELSAILRSNNNKASTNEIVEAAQEAGYNGVLFKNIYDIGNRNWEWAVGEDGFNVAMLPKGTTDVIVPFNASAIKSADPVTYDDNGNVIPLSERFNSGNEDIRYSNRNLDFGLTVEDVNKYITNAFSKVPQSDYLPFAKTRKRLISDVQAEITDISEYEHALRDNDIRHIKNSHGEGTSEKYPISKSDIELIPYIVNNYDKVYVVSHSNNNDSIYYVKALDKNNVFYLEQVTDKYGNRKLLINKQMVKVGIDDVPNFANLKDAITKKEGIPKFLADLNEIRKEYVHDDVEIPSTVTSIAFNKDTRQAEISETEINGDKVQRSSRPNDTISNEELLSDAIRLVEEGHIRPSKDESNTLASLKDTVQTLTTKKMELALLNKEWYWYSLNFMPKESRTPAQQNRLNEINKASSESIRKGRLLKGYYENQKYHGRHLQLIR